MFGIVAVALGGCATQTPPDVVSEETQFPPQAQERRGVKKHMAQQQQEEYVVDKSDYVDAAALTAEMPATELSDTERDGLLLMREEEKLARDVYTTLYEKWGQRIFTNIAGSEQTHMDAVKTLLDRYEVTDPVTDATVGVFTNAKLKRLYDELVAQGSTSLVAALTVGATIEDLDIKDLDNLMAQTDNADIITVYENLARGSRNHMRAFVRQLKNNGATYSAQYISQQELEAILAGVQERGNGGGKGRGGGMERNR